MSDMGELYNEYRQDRQQKRASNRQTSAQLLRDNGLSFTEHNNGAHLVVTGSNGIIYDFWPGTGMWMIRGSTRQYRGVKRLIKDAMA